MEPRETQFSHFDLLWLKELSHNEQETLNTMIRSFVNHVPAMIKEVKDALDENSVDKLQESIRKVSSVASMFTQKDYSRMLILGKEKSSQLSLYTVQQVNNLIDELASLQKEVSYYHNFSTSSGSKARRSAHR